ncbi:hypothetical protein LJB42_004596 [Komagataella kurtzmanii]|nr:hypothetical protein LJB42_004596 [Komagataella kurtzmanii]
MDKGRKDGKVTTSSYAVEEIEMSDASRRASEKEFYLDPESGESGSIKEHDIQRGLKSRHIVLIGLGGCIGTGIFIGTGASLATSGPAPLLISYILMSTVLWTIMNVLSEMAVYLPIKGVSVIGFIQRYCDESFAFACGYNIFYTMAILVATEVTAAGLVIRYWNESINIAVFMTIFLGVITVLNCFPNKYYGEIEFWFALVKIVTIIGLIILGAVIMLGGAPNHDRLGFRYWNNPGAFAEHLTTGGTGRFLGFWTAVIKSGFTFITGPELIITAASEAKRPRYNIPKVASSFVYRILAFYVLGSLVIGCTVAYNNPLLLTESSDASASPFVIAIQSAGIKVLPHIINAAILTSAWSSGNAFYFSATRILLGLARSGQAPAVLKKINRFGVPYYCVLVVFLFGCLSYLNVSSGSAKVFTWFTNLTTVSGFISWISCCWAYLRFRRAMILHGKFEERPYKTYFQPFMSYYSIIFLSIIILTNGYAVFIKGNWDTSNFIAAYITLPPFFLLWLGHKYYLHKLGKIPFTQVLIPIEEVDIYTGLDIVIAEAERDFAEIEAENATKFDSVFLKPWYWLFG